MQPGISVVELSAPPTSSRGPESELSEVSELPEVSELVEASAVSLSEVSTVPVSLLLVLSTVDVLSALWLALVVTDDSVPHKALEHASVFEPPQASPSKGKPSNIPIDIPTKRTQRL